MVASVHVRKYSSQRRQLLKVCNKTIREQKRNPKAAKNVRVGSGVGAEAEKKYLQLRNTARKLCTVSGNIHIAGQNCCNEVPYIRCII